MSYKTGEQILFLVATIQNSFQIGALPKCAIHYAYPNLPVVDVYISQHISPILMLGHPNKNPISGYFDTLNMII